MSEKICEKMRNEENGEVSKMQKDSDAYQVSLEDELDAFNEGALRTKNDILWDIDWLIRSVEEEGKSDTKHSNAYYTRYISLLRRFRAEVEDTVFPKKLEDWWRYEYDVKENGATLSLSHASGVDLNDDGGVDTVFIDTTFDLIHIKAEMMNVEKYASEYGVTTTTVRQWIRRGKIRSAVKMGSEWRIPELAEIRERGYQSAQYSWDDFLLDLPQEYEFLNEYRKVYLSQNKERKDLYDVQLIGKGEMKNLQMNQREREKFELVLISNPFVTPEKIYIYNRG